MTKSFEEQVNEVVGQMTQTEEGKWELPADVEVDEAVKYAANIERRRRDTQTAFNNVNKEKLALARERDQWVSQAEQDAVSRMSAEQQSELEELKHSDPDAWRIKLNEFEQANKQKFEDTKKTLAAKAVEQTEEERRKQMLEDWQKANPELQLDDDTIADNIPPKFIKQLERGEIDFEGFLDVAKTYLGKEKVVAPATDEPPTTPDLSKQGGGSMPSESAQVKDLASAYQDDVY